MRQFRDEVSLTMQTDKCTVEEMKRIKEDWDEKAEWRDFFLYAIDKAFGSEVQTLHSKAIKIKPNTRKRYTHFNSKR